MSVSVRGKVVTTFSKKLCFVVFGKMKGQFFFVLLTSSEGGAGKQCCYNVRNNRN